MILVLLSASLKQFSESNTTKSECKCQEWDTCEWSKSVVNTISLHPSNHPTRKYAESFFKEKKCSFRKRKVFCCNGKDVPTYKQLNKMKVFRSRYGIRNSGRWKPDSSKGECGLRIGLANIVGGKVAKVGEFPYMALLANNGYYTCGGSVINKWYVLTAAHCMQFDYDGNPNYPT